MTERHSRRVGGASKRSIDRVARALRKMIAIDDVLPCLQMIARVRHVARNLPAKVRDLRAEERQQDIARDTH